MVLINEQKVSCMSDRKVTLPHAHVPIVYGKEP